MIALAFALIGWLAQDASAGGLRIAVFAPERDDASRRFAAELAGSLSTAGETLDTSLVEAAFDATAPKTPLNMTAAEARIIGAAIGCDLFIMVKAVTQRRSSSEREEYYESYAAVYVVSSRTGRLVEWSFPRSEAAKPAESAANLLKSIPKLAAELAPRLKMAAAPDASDTKPSGFEEPPTEGTAAAKEFRSPVPYRRIKPEYTVLAFSYEVAATVDLEMDLDADGRIARTEIVRWAGYGLDESVEKAVRAMNWRPGERGGKPLPMRVLLRYNFKKIEK